MDKSPPSRIPKIVAYFAPLWGGLRSAFYAFLLVLVPSSVLLIITTIDSSVYNLLSDSRTSWWGVFTSIFVHSGIFHLFGNMAVMFGFLLVFVKLQQDLPMDTKRSRSTFFLASTFISGIVANILFLKVSSGSSAGASGVVFGSAGATLGFALFTAFPGDFEVKSMWVHFLAKTSGRLGLKGLVVFAVLLVYILMFPAEFLSPGPGVNVFDHYWSFFVGFGSVVAYQIFSLAQHLLSVS